ncbi:MAG: hypothetical protein ACLQK4_06240 [Acidimicrobiales bacterium]|jgi:hypothetical protein
MLRSTATADIEGLTPLDEPVKLLASLRKRAGSNPADIRENAPRELAAHAWQQWREPLSSLGLGEEHVQHAFATAKREIWLWVRGNRVWDQLRAHLAGRVLRRSAGSTSTSPHSSPHTNPQPG